MAFSSFKYLAYIQSIVNRGGLVVALDLNGGTLYELKKSQFIIYSIYLRFSFQSMLCLLFSAMPWGCGVN